jgi:uncharacterized protein (TIGR03435 family)
MGSHANRAAAQGPAPAAQTAAPQATAQSSVPAAATDLAGIWQGTLTPPNSPKGLRIVVKVTKDASGTYAASLFNADRGGPPLKFSTVTVQGAVVKFATPMMTIEGTLSADGNTVQGSWGAGGPNPLPISLARTAPDAAWPLPEPIKQMAADAKPSFDVVTVKPGQPGARGKNIGFDGHRLLLRNFDLDDMIALGFGMHAKQIVGAPDWADKDLFDVEGAPDVPGSPNQKQIQMLIQNLLADRLQLKFHKEQRELAVYAITIAPGGPKLTVTTAGPNDPSGMGFNGPNNQGVTAVGRNLTMADFAMWMQAAVMDRPMVDQTGLKDRYDLRVKWTPDDSQFTQFRGTGMTMPAPSDAADAPPSLYTAVQEQLGLKIDATRALDDVIVIDHIEKPSAN